MPNQDFNTQIKDLDREIEALMNAIALRKKKRDALEVLASMQDDTSVVVNVPSTTASTPIFKDVIADQSPASQLGSDADQFPTFRKADYGNYVRGLLAFIGNGVRSLEDIAQHYKLIGRKAGSDKDPYASIRTDMWKLKTAYNLVENKTTGNWSLTPLGSRFIDSKESETPSAGTEGVSDVNQATLTSGTESGGLI